MKIITLPIAQDCGNGSSDTNSNAENFIFKISFRNFKQINENSIHDTHAFSGWPL